MYTGVRPNAPKAYLNIILFDKNHNFVDAAYKQLVDPNAQQVGTTVKAPHEYLMREVTVTEPGYAYIFFSNENLAPIDVHFDDVTITHTHSNIVAGADYYPYGMAMEGRKIDDEPYRYGYQGQFSEEDKTTGWNEFELRFYDAKIARWLSNDPYGQYNSPYVAMGNMPQTSFDADGGWSWVGAGVGFGVGFVGGLLASEGNWRTALISGTVGGVAGGLLGSLGDKNGPQKATAWHKFRNLLGEGDLSANRNTYIPDQLVKRLKDPIQRATLSKVIGVGSVLKETFDQTVHKEKVIGLGRKVKGVRFSDESVPYYNRNRQTRVSRDGKDLPIFTADGSFPSDDMIKNGNKKITRYKVNVTDHLPPRGFDANGDPIDDQGLFQQRLYRVMVTIDVKMRRSTIRIHRMSGWR